MGEKGTADGGEKEMYSELSRPLGNSDIWNFFGGKTSKKVHPIYEHVYKSSIYNIDNTR